MTGPDHYAEAERLLARADHFTYGDGADPVAGQATATQALGHALLAQAAATISASAHHGQSQVDYLGEWMRVL